MTLEDHKRVNGLVRSAARTKPAFCRLSPFFSLGNYVHFLVPRQCHVPATEEARGIMGRRFVRASYRTLALPAGDLRSTMEATILHRGPIARMPSETTRFALTRCQRPSDVAFPLFLELSRRSRRNNEPIGLTGPPVQTATVVDCRTVDRRIVHAIFVRANRVKVYRGVDPLIRSLWSFVAIQFCTLHRKSKVDFTQNFAGSCLLLFHICHPCFRGVSCFCYTSLPPRTPLRESTLRSTLQRPVAYQSALSRQC